MVDTNKERDDDNTKHSGDDDDDGDEDLLNAVARWANQNEDKKDVHKPAEITAAEQNRKMSRRRDSDFPKKKPPLSSPSPYAAPYNPNANGIDSGPTDRNSRSSWSLHITNLPYSSTKEAIVKVFEDKGCKIASTRLVYNYHSTRIDRNRTKKNQGNNAFTGVAFVDMVDKGSYRKGLGMDKMQWLEPSCSPSDKKGAVSRDSRGRYRKINIRPTRTKEELTAIVKKTEDRLAFEKDLIKEERAERRNTKKRMMENKPAIRKDIGGLESTQAGTNGLKAKKSRHNASEPQSSDDKKLGIRADKSPTKSKTESDVSTVPSSEGKKRNRNGENKTKNSQTRKDVAIAGDEKQPKITGPDKKNLDEHTEKTPPSTEQVTEGEDGGIENKTNNTENERKQTKESGSEESKLPLDTIKNNEDTKAKKKKKRKKISKKERAKKAAILRTIKK